MHFLSHHAPRPASAGAAGVALWTFLMSTVHGVALALVPVLGPLCAGDASHAIGGWSLLLPALAALGVHLAAMLAVTAFLAVGMTRGARALWNHRMKGTTS